MLVLILEKVPVSLRGELSRWMIEPKAGVFVGTVSALVRDRLWQKVSTARGLKGTCIRVYTSNTEQGFLIESAGEPRRRVIDREGLKLVETRKEP
jgi:CRISPR-associated protein Cas2